MLHTRDATSFRDGRRVVHSTVLAVLTMAAMLLCVLAVHSAGAGHGLGHAPGHSLSAAKAATAVATVTATTAGAHSTNSTATHTASSVAPLSSDLASSVSGALLESLAPATATVAALAVGVIRVADTHALSGGATLSMMCSLLLVLGGLILLSRRPAAFRRLLEAGGFIVGSFREIPLHLRRPSLTLLSISRI